MSRKAVIFDMDGVICHTNPHHSIAFRRFFEKRGIYPTDEAFAKHMFGKSNAYILTHFLEREVSAAELVTMGNEKEKLFREIYEQHVETLPNFMIFLDALKSAGFATGVATSAPRANLDMIDCKVGFAQKMGSLMGSEDVNNHKPDPEVYLKSAHNLGVKTSDCVVFEDSFSGVSAAINASMKVVGVLSSHPKEDLPPCDVYINDYRDIGVTEIEKILNA